MKLKIALALYWVACYTATHTPIEIPPPIQYRFTDTVAHFGMYGLLGLLFALALPHVDWRKGAAILAAYGAFDELTQLLVNRNCTFSDWAADAAGGALGLWIAKLLISRRFAADRAKAPPRAH